MLERRTLPENIRAKMALWNLGLIPLPKSYIVFHKQLAHQTMAAMIDDGVIKVHNDEMVNDGWGDGMMVVQLIIELPDGTLLKAKWHDGSQNFMAKSPSGGWVSHEIFDDYRRVR